MIAELTGVAKLTKKNLDKGALMWYKFIGVLEFAVQSDSSKERR